MSTSTRTGARTLAHTHTHTHTHVLAHTHTHTEDAALIHTNIYTYTGGERGLTERETESVYATQQYALQGKSG
jgi:hypothetical protein